MVPFLLWMLAGTGIFMVYSRDAIFSTINQAHTAFLDVFMWIVTFIGDGAGTAVILFSMLLFFRSCRSWWYVLAAVVCTVAPALLIQVIKNIVQAARPLEVYKQLPDMIHHLKFWDDPHYNSFPSGHSGSVFSMCAFLSMILPRGRMQIGLGLFFLALLVAYSRMYLAAHFFADIFVGSLLGTLGAILCMALLRLWSGRSFRIVLAAPNRKNPPLI
jgi:membrane-associated phospholipid phosphatase